MTTLTELLPWDKVQIARNPQRPRTLDYIRVLCEDFFELRGDRHHGDDQALVCGISKIDGRSVAIIGHQKGSDTKENVRRNFGSPHPEGYRKALRVMEHAKKFNMPILTLIDTAGAHPSMAAEERGQAEAIARNLLVMADLPVPIIATVIGEGGSGGALAIGVADRLLMLEHAVYSVASPEASAAILWRDSSKASEAAKAMKITAQDLHSFGIADLIIPEPEGGAHMDVPAIVHAVGNALREQISTLSALTLDQLLDQRYAKYRAIGRFRQAQTEIVEA
ncbi:MULTISPECIES: acetyl-CoA carboxylase carboxyltransferase subunit alpha [Herpetosiphon]|uniref:Acetyl-coenzyme A carboxylase carboxyl transferase subunit alpha n=1 Tax=Herpetosiphon geysericola TaxID=70996 RepID=A0A0P6Y9I2_9CHLR|nr:MULTISPECIES: acetyl-CoA carboxylase carboxyltransferase subunit alpha [Herpetosiphon]KPL85839.1 acetyl-CoA carboxyl transferase [Herpetosiphon geysericola]